MKYIIGTRGSKLAMAQTGLVRDRLEKTYPEHEFEIQIIQTKGDRIPNKPLDQIGDKGLFVREIEEKILSGEVHIGVHSMKDMPAQPAEGLVFTKAWKREDPRDVLILREADSLKELPIGAVIGTGSKRREVQLKKLRPDIRVVGIRGNVDTRLRKMEEQGLDGIVLAAAGLHRLGMQPRITQYLEPEQMIPAPAQGTLALEVREDDRMIQQMLDALCDEETEAVTCAERTFLQKIGGDCHVPIGAYCEKKADETYQMRVLFGNETGDKLVSAFAEGADAQSVAAETVAKVRNQMAGTVYLVGAGPGDPGLITVKGLRAVREADCIVYDRLSSPVLLEEAKQGCEKIYVGKENHHHTMEQQEINKLLVEKALQYKKVLRLKGGDVYVFGRGGEEGIALRENGIPFEVIPGISSCTAGLAYAGIPVTHRGMAGGFHVVTAHDRNDELADIDFEAMARGKETCVFLMGFSKIREISGRLIEAGMPPDTEAAVISKATTNEQRVCTSALCDIAEETERQGLSSPALIVVGEVVRLREQLDFFTGQMLFGKKYLVPKIGTRVSRLTALLRHWGAGVCEVQVGKIVKRKIILNKQMLRETDWFVFTSRNGVEAFWENLVDSGLDARSLANSKIAVIGEKTSECLKEHGMCADLVPSSQNSDVLAEEFLEKLNGSEKVWYVKAEHTDSGLADALSGRCCLEEIPVYANEPLEYPDFEPGSLQEYDGILFTCASSVVRFASLCGDKWKECAGKVNCFSIGPKTTACLREQGAERIKEAQQASYEAFAEMIRRELDV